MRKRYGVIALVGMIVLALVATTNPAGASASGTAVFTCNVTLPIWPTTNGPAVNCNGKASGYVVGSTTTGQHYEILAANDRFVGAASSYRETCIANEPLTGTAKGTTYTYGLQRIVGPQGTATSATPFNWSRVGTTAVITLGAGTITWTSGAIARGRSGVAVAHFAVTSPLVPPNCANPKKVKAAIQGAALFIT